jgi:hypothetical protein
MLDRTIAAYRMNSGGPGTFRVCSTGMKWAAMYQAAPATTMIDALMLFIR